MMKLKKNYTVRYMNQGIDYGIITVPKGTKVSNRTAMGEDKNYHFVDEFKWVPNHPSGIPQHMLLHDLKHYGLNVPKDYIDYE